MPSAKASLRTAGAARTRGRLVDGEDVLGKFESGWLTVTGVAGVVGVTAKFESRWLTIDGVDEVVEEEGCVSLLLIGVSPLAGVELSKITRTSPTFAVCPSLTRISRTRPETGAGRSASLNSYIGCLQRARRITLPHYGSITCRNAASTLAGVGK